jgi:hypothetical protein
MPIDQSVIDSLVANPAETLTVERKRWIDPSTPAGQEKITKTALALRNRNGGYLVVGFDDKTMAPDVGHEPADVRTTFNQDTIQGLISRYASETFETLVAFGVRDGIEYPVIVIPPGVNVPVAAKRNLADNSKVLVRLGAVYFRTLNANGTASTAEARPEDWREIFEICFDNREADIGRFLRRHLAGQDIASFISKIREFEPGASPPVAPTQCDRAVALLHDGHTHFQTALNSRSLQPEEAALANAGFMDIALVISPPRNNVRPNQAFLSTVASSNPNYTGWPIWIDSRNSGTTLNRPAVVDGAWQALVFSVMRGRSNHLDFWRLNPVGEFYIHRILQDDGAPDKVSPGTAIDPVIMILRVAEAIAVGLGFAKALGCDPETTTLGFAFKWTNLAGRHLTRWADPFDNVGGGLARQNEVTTCVELSLDTPLSAIAPVVEKVVQDLFVVFDGASIPTATIEHWVQRLIERRLN